MFREMRRKRQELSREDCISILTQCQTGILAVSGEDGYPYAVPLNYVFLNSRIYFHCASSGHKLDAIRKNNKVSFCVIGQDQVVPEKFSTHYESVIAFGNAVILEGEARRPILEALNQKYSPDYPMEGREAIEKYWDQVCIVEIQIVHMTGKASL